MDVIAVTRAVDDLLAARAIREDAGRAPADLTSAAIGGHRGNLPRAHRPGPGPTARRLLGFLDRLANNPGDMAARTQLSNAQTLVDSLDGGAADLAGVRTRRSPG